MRFDERKIGTNVALPIWMAVEIHRLAEERGLPLSAVVIQALLTLPSIAALKKKRDVT